MTDRRRALQSFAALLLAGCATMPGSDPIQVLVVGVEPLPGEGLELRFLCKLRVQNPNDAPIAFSGAAIQLQVRGIDFASGVSDVAGTVPRYGETLVEVPVAASALRMARVALDVFNAGEDRRLEYVLKGKLGGPMFGTVRFESRGELKMPASAAP